MLVLAVTSLMAVAACSVAPGAMGLVVDLPRSAASTSPPPELWQPASRRAAAAMAERLNRDDRPRCGHTRELRKWCRQHALATHDGHQATRPGWSVAVKVAEHREQVRVTGSPLSSGLARHSN